MKSQTFRRNNFTLILIITFIAILVNSNDTRKSFPPFIQPDTIHPTLSQFELNLILNENRNLPVIFVQYSKDNSKRSIDYMIEGALRKQPGIAIALLIDCRHFAYDLNHTLNICSGFDPQKAKEEQKIDQQLSDEEKKQDRYFRFDFLSPNPSRIKEKGHLLSKNHDIQNLRELSNRLNDDFLAKVIRNEIPDLVTYIEDNYDMDEFIETKSNFTSSKRGKILFFDQNLQAPLFLKKLAARLDGIIKVGVTDNYKLAKKHNIFYDSILLMEFDYSTLKYTNTKLSYSQNNQLNDIINNDHIQKYLKLQKYRDILLDFQHKTAKIYNMSTLGEINQLMTYGRLVYLQIENTQNQGDCDILRQIKDKYDIFFNYVCFRKDKIKSLENAGLNIKPNSNNIYIIDKSIKNADIIQYQSTSFNAYDHLPQLSVRQKISVESQAEMCLKTAFASKRDSLFYWYNEKQNKNTLKLLQYFNSLPEITSLIHFCQIYLPNKDLIEKFQLHQNCLFSMNNMNQKGQMQKFEFKQALQFVSIKMFLREISINQMTKVYEQKLFQNSITQINSAEDLTKQCFNKQCIVGLIATNKFRYESQLQILKQLKLQTSDMGYNIVWLDISCHWDVAKQLKLIPPKQKVADRSYVIYYKQKNNNYALMVKTGQTETTKYWVKKDVKRWLKTLKQPGIIKSLKFGIDIEDKKCQVSQPKKQQPNTSKPQQPKSKKSNQVGDSEL